MTEQGLRKLTQLAANYSHGYMIWFGPITLMIVFCHPDMLRSITNASGTHAELVMVGAMTHLWASSSSLPSFYVAPTNPTPLPLVCLSHLSLSFKYSPILFLLPLPSSQSCLYPTLVFWVKDTLSLEVTYLVW